MDSKAHSVPKTDYACFKGAVGHAVLPQLDRWVLAGYTSWLLLAVCLVARGGEEVEVRRRGGRRGCDGVTNTDYVRMKGVVGHECLHNWTGGCCGVVESFERPGGWVPCFCEGRGVRSARWLILGRHMLQDTNTSVNGRVGAERWQHPTTHTHIHVTLLLLSIISARAAKLLQGTPLAWLRPSFCGLSPVVLTL